LGNVITSGATYAREINSRLDMAKAAFNKKKTFNPQIGLKFKEETSEVLHLERGFVALKLGQFGK